eukprot:gene12605-14794_t
MESFNTNVKQLLPSTNDRPYRADNVYVDSFIVDDVVVRMEASPEEATRQQQVRSRWAKACTVYADSTVEMEQRKSQVKSILNDFEWQQCVVSNFHMLNTNLDSIPATHDNIANENLDTYKFVSMGHERSFFNSINSHLSSKIPQLYKVRLFDRNGSIFSNLKHTLNNNAFYNMFFNENCIFTGDCHEDKENKIKYQVYLTKTNMNGERVISKLVIPRKNLSETHGFNYYEGNDLLSPYKRMEEISRDIKDCIKKFGDKLEITLPSFSKVLKCAEEHDYWFAFCYEKDIPQNIFSPAYNQSFLLNVYDNYGRFITKKWPKEDQFIFKSDSQDAEVGQPSITNKVTFLENFNERTNGQFIGFNWNNTVVTGSIITSCLVDQSVGYEDSDINVVFYGLTSQEIANRIHEYLASLPEDSKYTLIKSFRGSLMVARHYPNRCISFQVEPYLNMSHVLLTNDIGACSFAYDGSDLYCLYRSMESINYRCSFVTNHAWSMLGDIHYHSRIIKYYKRGFSAVSSDLKFFSLLPDFQAHFGHSGLALLLSAKHKGEIYQFLQQPFSAVPFGPQWTNESKNKEEEEGLRAANEFQRNQFIVRQLLEHILDIKLQYDSLYPALRDGRILCKLMNTFHTPADIIHYSDFEPMQKTRQLENVQLFLKKCRLYVEESRLFHPNDLLDGTDMPRVLDCLLALFEHFQEYINVDDIDYEEGDDCFVAAAPVKGLNGYILDVIIETRNYIMTPLFIAISVGVGVKLSRTLFLKIMSFTNSVSNDPIDAVVRTAESLQLTQQIKPLLNIAYTQLSKLVTDIYAQSLDIQHKIPTMSLVFGKTLDLLPVQQQMKQQMAHSSPYPDSSGWPIITGTATVSSTTHWEPSSADATMASASWSTEGTLSPSSTLTSGSTASQTGTGSSTTANPDSSSSSSSDSSSTTATGTTGSTSASSLSTGSSTTANPDSSSSSSSSDSSGTTESSTTTSGTGSSTTTTTSSSSTTSSTSSTTSTPTPSPSVNTLVVTQSISSQWGTPVTSQIVGRVVNSGSTAVTNVLYSVTPTPKGVWGLVNATLVNGVTYWSLPSWSPTLAPSTFVEFGYEVKSSSPATFTRVQ